MIPALFWTFAGVVVIAAIGADCFSSKLTSDQNKFIWAVVLCLVFVPTACAIAYLLLYCWRKRIAMIAGRYGGGRQYSRDAQPIRYWCVMIYWALFLLASLAAVSFSVSTTYAAAKHLFK